MHPTLIKFFNLTIYSYGFMVALGFSIATFFIYKRASEVNFDKNKVVDMAIISLLCGIAGARLFYVFLNRAYYLSRPIEIIDLTKGGLVWYGGFLAGFLALIIYARVNKIDMWAGADLIAPYLALAQSFGRIGCFLNGCCFGLEASQSFPLGVRFPADTVVRQPAQLYSSLALLLIFVILRLWQDKKHFTGEIFLGYCILYAVKRFAMEFMRGDNPHIFAGLTISQCLSVVVGIFAAAIFIYKAILWKRKYSNSG